MNNSKVYLAVDLGAESGRVVAGQYDGQLLTLEELHRFVNGPVDLGGSLHWDILRIFSEIKVGIAIAAERFPGSLVSLGVDSWGVDYGLLDNQDKLIGNPFHYRDSRTAGMEAEVFKRVPREEIYDVTGIQFLCVNTLYQLFSEVCCDSTQLAIARRLLFVPDLVNFWLTGEKVNERTIASTSQLLDARSGTWATSLIERLSIPKDLFGEIVPPGTPLQKLSSHVSNETGAGELVVVAPGCHDTASAVAAVPTQLRGFAYVSSGSWSLMGVESSKPIITVTSRESGFASEGGVCDTFCFLRNINGLWLIEECRRSWLAEGIETSYESLFQASSEARPFSAIIDSNDSLLQTPGDMPAKIAEFCRRTGQRPPANPGSLIRTILESLALRYRFVLDKLEEAIGYRLEPLHIVGGGTRNALLNQFAANAANRMVITGPVEATSAGNILVQLIASDDLSTLDEGRELILRSFETRSYEPEDVDSWTEAYERFKKFESSDNNS